MDVKTRNVSLSPTLDALVEEKVASGMYNSASEVVRAALRLLQEHDLLQQAKLDALREDIQVGLDDIANGRVHDGEEVFAELKKRARLHK